MAKTKPRMGMICTACGRRFIGCEITRRHCGERCWRKAKQQGEPFPKIEDFPGARKELRRFWVSRTRKDRNRYRQEYLRRKPDKCRAYAERARAKLKMDPAARERANAAATKRRHQDPEKARALQKLQRDRNPEKHRQRSRARSEKRRQDQPDKERARVAKAKAKLFEKDPARKREYDRRYRLKHSAKSATLAARLQTIERKLAAAQLAPVDFGNAKLRNKKGC